MQLTGKSNYIGYEEYKKEKIQILISQVRQVIKIKSMNYRIIWILVVGFGQ